MGEGQGGPRALKPYRVELRPAADRELRKIDRANQERIRERIDALAVNPRPSGVKALHGSSEGLLRFRVGEYRVIYQVKDAALLVVVVTVGHRREVYR